MKKYRSLDFNVRTAREKIDIRLIRAVTNRTYDYPDSPLGSLDLYMWNASNTEFADAMRYGIQIHVFKKN